MYVRASFGIYSAGISHDIGLGYARIQPVYESQREEGIGVDTAAEAVGDGE
jgi:hypothetical protein